MSTAEELDIPLEEPAEVEPVEPIDPDDDDEGESNETPAAPEAEPEAFSEKEIEALHDKLEREAKRHTGRITEIMGEDANALLPCELCEPSIPGWRWPIIQEGDPREALYAIVNGGEGEGYADDPDAEACDRCNALGAVLTHSRVPGQETIPCSKCAAKGWTNAQDRTNWDAAETARTQYASPPAAQTGYVDPAATTLAKDMWGRPQGAPFFGRDPLAMSADELNGDWQRPRI